MDLLSLFVVLCLNSDANNCQAYEIDYNLTEEDCDHYYTDSGVQELESKLSLYVPMYNKQDYNDVIISCEASE